MGNSQTDSFMLEKLIGGRVAGAVLCGILLVLPTVIASDDNAYWLIPQVASLALLTVLVVRPRLPEPVSDLLVISVSPVSALWLIAASNGAVWISYLVSSLGVRQNIFGWPLKPGFVPFENVAIVWFLALVPFSIYEIFTVVKVLISGSRRQKVWAYVGILGLAVQFGTMRFIYNFMLGA